MRRLIFFIPLFWMACQSQKADQSVVSNSNPVLFTVGDSAVYADEFIYVYRKNNSQLDSAFTREDIADYLGLYENFKVKIMEAYARGYDTLASYQTELATYTEQLKEPYLTETRVTEELINEAFQRTREEIRASHILIRFPERPAPKDTLNAFNRITQIREMALRGLPFDSLAMTYSEDPSARSNKGDLGYFTSMQMVYPFESAAFATPEGSVSPVVRTRFGYHILKVFDRRAAHGQVVVSHLMLRPTQDSAAVRNRIFEIHDMAVGGADWKQLVQEYSEDMNSRDRGGIINPFSVGQAPFPFQEAAFSLSAPGEISDPVQTQFGWHIIRLEETRPLPSLEALEPTIRRRIEQDERAQLGQEFLVRRLKEEWGFTENKDARNLLLSLADSSLNKGQWQKPASTNDQVMFTIGDRQVSLNEFLEDLEETQEVNARAPGDYIIQKYNEFRDQTIIDWEESHLEEKYPEYRMLLREYREGILYFQLMEEQIWNPASEDSVGQQKYYLAHPEKYKGSTTAHATVYALPDSTAAIEVEQILMDGGDVPSNIGGRDGHVGSPLLPVEVEWAKDENSPWKSVPQKEGIYRKNILGKWYVIRVNEVVENEVTPFKKIRGQVISDYQQFLEKEWVRQLREKYPVKRNEAGVNYIYEALVR